MTRSKHILALLVSLVALVAIAPAASAANGTDRVKWNSVDANGVRYSSVAPNPRATSLDPQRRHARIVAPAKPRASVLKPARRHFR